MKSVYKPKLYWRVKVNGKYSWRPAEVTNPRPGWKPWCTLVTVEPLEEEE